MKKPNVLWPLLVPWETGKVLHSKNILAWLSNTHYFQTGYMHAAGLPSIPVNDVIWIATSNLAQEIILETESKGPLNQSTYQGLMSVVRDRLSKEFGVRFSALQVVVYTVDDLDFKDLNDFANDFGVTFHAFSWRRARSTRISLSMQSKRWQSSLAFSLYL